MTQPIIASGPAPLHRLSTFHDNPFLDHVDQVLVFEHHVFAEADRRALRELSEKHVPIAVELGVLKEFDTSGEDCLRKLENVARVRDVVGGEFVIRGDEPLNMLRHPRNMWVSQEVGGGAPPGAGHRGWDATPRQLGYAVARYMERCDELLMPFVQIEAWPWPGLGLMSDYLAACWEKTRPDGFVLDIDTHRMQDDLPRWTRWDRAAAWLTGATDPRPDARREQRRDVAAVANYWRGRTVPFGVIVGMPLERDCPNDDAGYMASARRHVEWIRETLGGWPDCIDVESWGIEGDKAKPSPGALMAMTKEIYRLTRSQ